MPLITDFAKTDEARQILQFFSTDIVIGRPFVTSPGVPAERVALLRKAFDSLMKDPAFRDDAKKAGIDISPVAGDDDPEDRHRFHEHARRHRRQGEGRDGAERHHRAQKK